MILQLVLSLLSVNGAAFNPFQGSSGNNWNNWNNNNWNNGNNWNTGNNNWNNVMNQPQQWNQGGGMNPWDQQGAGCGCHSGGFNQQQDGITPVFLFTDGGNSRALMLHPDAQSFEPAVYSKYWNAGRLFCISQRETPQTPRPLYAYRLDKGNQQYNHFYTTNAAEIGVTRAGQVGNYGYRCLGILGYVGTQETAAQGHRRMIPIYRWYSGSLNQHLFDPDEGLGARLNQGYGAEGTMGYVYQC